MKTLRKKKKGFIDHGSLYGDCRPAGLLRSCSRIYLKDFCFAN